MIRHAFFLIGPPGSGKSTVSGIAKQVGVTVISTRELLEGQGSDIQKKMKSGILAPDQQIITLVENEIKKINRNSLPILIDTPRSLVQAKSLWKFLTRHRYHISSILLRIDTAEALNRILKRAQEKKSKGEDPRDDDNLETATRRIGDYDSYGPRIWDWLADHTDTYQLNNMKTPDKIAEEARRMINVALSCTQEVHVPGHVEFDVTHF